MVMLQVHWQKASGSGNAVANGSLVTRDMHFLSQHFQLQSLRLQALQVPAEPAQLQQRLCIGIMQVWFPGALVAAVSQRPVAVGTGQLELPAAHQLLQHRLLPLLVACRSCTTIPSSWFGRMSLRREMQLEAAAAAMPVVPVVASGGSAVPLLLARVRPAQDAA